MGGRLPWTQRWSPPIIHTHACPRPCVWVQDVCKWPSRRGVLKGVLKSSCKSLLNFCLIVYVSPTLSAQKIPHYTGDLPVLKYWYTYIHVLMIYIFPIPTISSLPTSKCWMKKENTAYWCIPLVNKLIAHPWVVIPIYFSFLFFIFFHMQQCILQQLLAGHQ
jgi:hypothetical protein